MVNNLVVDHTRNISPGASSHAESESFGNVAKNQTKHYPPQKSSSPDIKNKDLHHKTQQMQDEFDQMMIELHNKRQDRNGDAFYEAHNEFYYNDPDQKTHDSPTMRLVQHKNTAVDHKKVMKASNVQKGDYSLVYTTSPKKSYIIEPHGGELNYKLAQKNPEKFYEQVFN